MNEDNASFTEVKSRLDQIVEEVSREDISLDDALSLYEEAVKLGLGACNLSEKDIFPEEIAEVEAELQAGEAQDGTAAFESNGLNETGSERENGSVVVVVEEEPQYLKQTEMQEVSTDATSTI